MPRASTKEVLLARRASRDANQLRKRKGPLTPKLSTLNPTPPPAPKSLRSSYLAEFVIVRACSLLTVGTGLAVFGRKAAEGPVQ